MLRRSIVFMLCLLSLPVVIKAGELNKSYSLWYERPALNRGSIYDKVVSRGFPFDEDWERWSLPLGNGYMGVNIFGRTDTERIQIAEKTLGNMGPYNGRGNFTNFAEIYLDIFHNGTKGYRRELRLNDAVSTVDYEHNGVNYSREYFVSYPANVVAVKLKSDTPGMLSFRVRPVLPYLNPGRENDGRTGVVSAKGDLITMSGKMEYMNLDYEGQVKVLNYGGSIEARNNASGDGGTIEVNRADSVVILIAAGTSYQLNEGVFVLPHDEKCKGNEHPHRAVSERIASACSKGYDALKAEHVADYQSLFNRVDLCLTDEISDLPTDRLLHSYQEGTPSPYLEELFFQYGRYLLISASRPGALPANLQGAWTQYDVSPWSGGYWHNINVQMNYWHAFNTNLTELFEPFVNYNEAYRKAAQINAVNYITKNNPDALSPVEGENGWAIGTGASAFGIGSPGGHSGPGTGGFTTKMYWDYYDFTRDKEILEKHTYPALLGMAKFLSKTLKPNEEGWLLANPSSSPENQHNGVPYQTVGCTFDQGMIWENFNDLLAAAKILKKKDPFLKVVEEQITKLDPVHIGASGQLKEYREENKYSDIGDPHHRHISHLCLVYPGTLINGTTPEWEQGARVALEMRGESPSLKGWSMAHRQAAWARLKNGSQAYKFYRMILTDKVMENLWGVHPPFQIDANFGGTAGVAEMLLQSHAGYIEPLAALPENWSEGSFSGLKARGNFEVSASWRDGKVAEMSLLSNKGETCSLLYNGIGNADIKDGSGKPVKFKVTGADKIEFKTKAGETYHLTLK